MPVVALVTAREPGAALGALEAAARLNLQTAGYTRADSPMAYELNVLVSDATLYFGRNKEQARQVYMDCLDHGKPLLWVQDTDRPNLQPELRMWIERNKIRSLNVIGKYPAKDVERLLRKVLPKCR